MKAIVVADSFDTKFYPVTLNKPRCLFPVANRPLLSYTLEFLVSNAVREIYIYCCHCADQVKSYLNESKWTSDASPCKVETITSQDFTSFGDVLRDVDERSLCENDFIAIYGDVVSNIHLKTALNEHMARREKDKTVPLMTCVCRTSSPSDRTRTFGHQLVAAIESSSNRLLHWDTFKGNPRHVNFPLSLFLNKDRNDVQLRYDLYDTGIWICSPTVSQLFTDNFDYQSQMDFIKGVITNEEFLGNEIHVSISQSQYCSRIHNFQSYNVVNKDVLRRWTHPYVPETQFTNDVIAMQNRALKRNNGYNLLRHNVYIHSTCTLKLGSQVVDNSIIGENTRVGEGCQITNSIIGAGVTIGNNCVIENSFIWDGADVCNGCTIKHSLLCYNTTLYENCTLQNGCVLCDQISVGPDISLDNGVLYQEDDDQDDSFDESDEDDKKMCDVTLVGSLGNGVLWEDEDYQDICRGLCDLTITSQHLDEEDSSDEDDNDSIDNLSDNDAIMEPIADDFTNFYREVKDSLQNGFAENVSCDNLMLELNASKYAYNMTLEDVTEAVIKSLIDIASEHATEAGSAYFVCLKKILQYCLGLLEKYIKTASSQIDCLRALEDCALAHEKVANCMIKILMYLYENDVLSEEVILKWNSNPRSENHDASMTLRTKITKFIQWLEEAEEESDEESDSD